MFLRKLRNHLLDAVAHKVGVAVVPAIDERGASQRRVEVEDTLLGQAGHGFAVHVVDKLEDVVPAPKSGE